MSSLAMITGAGSGIGLALSRALLDKGFEILAIGRRLPPLQALAHDHPGRVECLALDVSSEAAPRTVLAALDTRAPALVVHNAGVLAPAGPLAGIERDAFRQLWEINVAAPLFLTAALLPRLARGARILHVSSGAAHRALAGWGPYCISKSALHMLYQCWREELQDQGVLVGSARPGVVDTPMQESIRALSADDFPAVEHFRQLKRDGALTSADECGRFLAWLLTEAEDELFSIHEHDIRDPELARRWRAATP